VYVIPDDPDALDTALAAGRSLAEAAPSSPARKALRDLAASLVGRRPAAPRRRVLGRL
jgi:Flp pilus assembly CpaE family ATPase